MFSAITRRFAIAAAFLAAFALAGCGDKEPAQRKAFIDFLQTRVLAQKSLSVPFMNDKEKDAIGPYVAHYQVILDFNNGLNDAMKSLGNATNLQRKLTNVQGLQENWQEVATLHKELPKIGTALSDYLQKAQTARAGLKQPDDLKVVYDQAYAKMVTVPADAMKAVLPPMDSTFQAMEDLGRFLAENKTKVKVSGMMMEIQDPSIQAKLQALQAKYTTEAQGLMAAVRPLMALVGR